MEALLATMLLQPHLWLSCLLQPSHENATYVPKKLRTVKAHP